MIYLPHPFSIPKERQRSKLFAQTKELWEGETLPLLTVSQNRNYYYYYIVCIYYKDY